MAHPTPFDPFAQQESPTIEEAFDVQRALELLTKKLQAWLETGIEMLPNVIVAVLVLVVFWILGRIARKTFQRIFGKIFDNVSIVRLFSNVTGFVVLLIGLFIGLEVLQLDKAVTSLLAGAGVIGLALGFAFQSIASNFISGTLLSVRQPFAVGDLIETNDHTGVVEVINLRTTVLRRPDGPMVRIPNKDVYETPLVNYSHPGRRRVELNVGVSYGEDLEEVRRVAIEAVEQVPDRLTDRDVELFFEGFGGSSIDFVVRFWIPFASSNADYLRARSAAIREIKSAFDREGIVIPFPIRTLDFGIKGGKELSEVAAEWPRAAESAEDS